MIAVLPVLWQVSKSRTFQVAGTLVPRVQIADSLIALTFDDGPTPGYTDEVLSILEEHKIPATFFVTGRETERYLEEAKKIVDAGRQLGNHSWSHSRMVLKSPGFVRGEIERTDRVIREAGYAGTIYFRPTYNRKLLVLP